MYMGEPIAQVFIAENGFLLVVPDEEAEAKAEAEAKKNSKDGKCGCGPYLSMDERQKKLVFPKIADVLKYLKQELPALAKDQKADFDSAFNED